jgi:hypothetical protein
MQDIVIEMIASTLFHFKVGQTSAYLAIMPQINILINL